MAYTVSKEWFEKGREAALKGGFKHKPTWEKLGIKTEHEWKSWNAGYLPYRRGLFAGKQDGGLGRMSIQEWRPNSGLGFGISTRPGSRDGWWQRIWRKFLLRARDGKGRLSPMNKGSKYPFAFDPVTGRHGFKKVYRARLSDEELKALKAVENRLKRTKAAKGKRTNGTHIRAA
jgi:hypothetical protein